LGDAVWSKGGEEAGDCGGDTTMLQMWGKGAQEIRVSKE